jgi:hypothetical protein
MPVQEAMADVIPRDTSPSQLQLGALNLNSQASAAAAAGTQQRQPVVELASSMLSLLNPCTTKEELTYALNDGPGMGIAFTWSDDIELYVNKLLCGECDYMTHEDYISYRHPLLGKEVKLSTHMNTVRSAPARLRNAYTELTKIEQELSALVQQRADVMMGLIDYEIEARVYADFIRQEHLEKSLSSNLKVDLQVERKRLARKSKKALKRKERELLAAAGSKRHHSDDDDDDEENEHDREFIADERAPKKHRAADSGTIRVTVCDLRGLQEEYDIDLHAQVIQLKAMIVEGSVTRAEDIRLVYRGHPLVDEHTLHQHQIAHGARIKFVPALSGGGSTIELKFIVIPHMVTSASNVVDLDSDRFKARMLSPDLDQGPQQLIDAIGLTYDLRIAAMNQHRSPSEVNMYAMMSAGYMLRIARLNVPESAPHGQAVPTPRGNAYDADVKTINLMSRCFSVEGGQYVYRYIRDFLLFMHMNHSAGVSIDHNV